MQGDTQDGGVMMSGDAAAEEAPYMRPRWHGEFVFYMAAIGSSIGIGNIWKFPALSFKHGGPAFVIGYLIIMLLVGVPMLILEITLG